MFPDTSSKYLYKDETKVFSKVETPNINGTKRVTLNPSKKTTIIISKLMTKSLFVDNSKNERYLIKFIFFNLFFILKVLKKSFSFF